MRRMGTAGALLAKSFGLIDQIFLCIVYSFKATVSLHFCCTEMKRAVLEITQAEPCWDKQLLGTSRPPQTTRAEGPRVGWVSGPGPQRLPKACSRQGRSHGHWLFVSACPEVLAEAQGSAMWDHALCQPMSLLPAVRRQCPASQPGQTRNY